MSNAYDSELVIEFPSIARPRPLSEKGYYDPCKMLLDESDRGKSYSTGVRCHAEIPREKIKFRVADSGDLLRKFQAEIDGKSYIIKHAFIHGLEKLTKEAGLYQDYLQHLYGTVVPHYYGLYRGVDQEGDACGCIIFEDCGTEKAPRFSTAPIDEKFVLIIVIDFIILVLTLRAGQKYLMR